MFKMRFDQAFLAQELILLAAIKHSLFIFVFWTFYFEFFETKFILLYCVCHPKVFWNYFSGRVLYAFFVNRTLDNLSLFIKQPINTFFAQAVSAVQTQRYLFMIIKFLLASLTLYNWLLCRLKLWTSFTFVFLFNQYFFFCFIFLNYYYLILMNILSLFFFNNFRLKIFYFCIDTAIAHTYILCLLSDLF